MKTRNYIGVVAALGIGLAGASSVARAADSNHRLLSMWGQFQMDNGETQTIYRGQKIKGYRICMEDSPGAVPLKVLHDGEESIVQPGECDIIEANKVKLTSAGKLQDGMTLIGSFNAGDMKRYRGSRNVADTRGDR